MFQTKEATISSESLENKKKTPTLELYESREKNIKTLKLLLDSNNLKELFYDLNITELETNEVSLRAPTFLLNFLSNFLYLIHKNNLIDKMINNKVGNVKQKTESSILSVLVN